MRPKLIHFLSSLVIFCSCATSYKTGVTPDDVYYSPVPVVETTDDSSNDNAQAPVNIDSVQQDRQITMGIQDSRWRNFGYDYDYYYSPYYNTYGYHSYGLNNYYYDNWYGNMYAPMISYGGFGNYYGYYSGYYYNPYYGLGPTEYPHQSSLTSITGPTRVINSAAYHSGYNNSNRTNTGGVTTPTPVRHYNNRNRTINIPSGNSSTNRPYTPSSDSNQGASGSGSGASSGGRRITRPN